MSSWQKINTDPAAVMAMKTDCVAAITTDRNRVWLMMILLKRHDTFKMYRNERGMVNSEWIAQMIDMSIAWHGDGEM